ncbi:ElaB/YqjD/DUF883 family membrane-anchored ribosome-binding protein [Yoonia maritima]|uniref:ElaB/YqjD/DUF883 family membrane-anchored ribosome-binding protein n=1 Tax=Yoonia maritima TaxID=1435347 RepID=A0A2T0VY58_9RHOB|nr:DUF883 family protein [Yoonia maritima]PRY77197.1 ElaB/YqjD/DUF883 family membrane-anchored ribosome-binding protein [Yoonia maritima]
MAQSTKSNVSDLGGDINKQMAVLREDIANLTATVADYGKAQGTQLKSVAMDKAANAATAGAATASAAKQTAEAKYAEAENAVRANPGAAVGIAAGLGFVVGMLTSRR